MDGFKAYRYFMSLKLHFTSDTYDVFKTGGRVKGTREAFEKRNDKYLFEKLAKRFQKDRELIQYLTANFAYGNEFVIWNTSDADQNYSEWIRRKESRTKIFQDDLIVIQNNYSDFDEIFSFTSSGIPAIISLLWRGKITIETVVCINNISGLIASWKRNNQITETVKGDVRKIEKLDKFVKYDSYRLVPIFNEFVSEMKEKVHG